MNRNGPIESSTLLPKIQRNSMFPPRCSSPPCMNIAVNGVIQVDGCESACPETPDMPSHSDCPDSSSSWQCLPGCVSS